MTAKTNAAALTIINRKSVHETETRTLRGNINELELTIEEKRNVYEALNRIGDGVGGGKASAFDRAKKPVSELKAIQALTSFTGDRRRFREWNDKASSC